MIPLRSRILDVGVRATFHTLLLLSLFFLVRGHNAPGGGFAGGLVAGAAFVLARVARGPQALRVLNVRPEPLVGLGLLVAMVVGLGGLVFEGAFLTSGELLVVHTDLLGDLEVSSVLAFDVGIYLVVLGFVTLLLERLGTDVTDRSAP